MLLLIDNYDSFTHNLARYFEELGQEVIVVRNDEICIAEIRSLRPDYLVLSPGPCTPNSSGITLEAIKIFAGLIPILGVCLGHQAIGQAFGANVIQAQQVKHGKTSQIYHSNSTLFKDVPIPFVATRYHSLVLDRVSIPNDFTITAWCSNSDNVKNNSVCEDLIEKTEVMAIEHNTQAIFGVQFHPESLLTEFGHRILNNFLNSQNISESSNSAVEVLLY
jgi:anthranilate synthase/aminodeoxychorismate synthase-like glutamine amidotransferase